MDLQNVLEGWINNFSLKLLRVGGKTKQNLMFIKEVLKQKNRFKLGIKEHQKKKNNF